MRRAFGVILLLVVGPAQAVLLSILGGQAVYDSNLDITWVADANLAMKHLERINIFHHIGQPAN